MSLGVCFLVAVGAAIQTEAVAGQARDERQRSHTMKHKQGDSSQSGRTAKQEGQYRLWFRC